MNELVLKVHHRIPRPSEPTPEAETLRRHARRTAQLSWPYLLAGSALGAPGLGVRWHLAMAGARRVLRSGASLSDAYPFLFDAFDTVRHFEFEVCWNWLRGRRKTRVLDLSSPRMLPFLLAANGVCDRLVMVNPDASDLAYSRRLASVLGVDETIEFRCIDSASLGAAPAEFDIVTSISVLEHIPLGNDREAFDALWNKVAPGGMLVITVPCARTGFEEFIDYNQYGLLKNDSEGFVFGQRFYDASALAALYDAAGEPREQLVFGERAAGIFFADRSKKCSTWLPKTWREPTFTARNFRRFRTLDELPGIGVVAMRFEKAR